MAKKIMCVADMDEFLAGGEHPFDTPSVEEHEAREAWLLLGADYRTPLMQPCDELLPPCDGLEQ